MYIVRGSVCSSCARLVFSDVFPVVEFSMLELSLLCTLFEAPYVLFAFLLLFYDVILVVQLSMLGL